jgi:glc operon protein GlcG
MSGALVSGMAATLAMAAAAPTAGGQPAAPAPVAAPAPAPGYGAPVTLDRAKRLVAAAEAEARRHDFLMAFAIVEPSGALVAFERMDGVQYGSLEVAQAKARSAALFRRPSKAFADTVSQGKVGVMTLPGAVAVEGGIPIVVDGKIVGAIGVSGGSSEQDGAVAMAALAATP